MKCHVCGSKMQSITIFPIEFYNLDTAINAGFFDQLTIALKYLHRRNICYEHEIT